LARRLIVPQQFALFNSQTRQFLNKNIPQSIAAKYFRCGGIFNSHFTINLLIGLNSERVLEETLRPKLCACMSGSETECRSYLGLAVSLYWVAGMLFVDAGHVRSLEK